jgi:hypothetical protein
MIPEGKDNNVSTSAIQKLISPDVDKHNGGSKIARITSNKVFVLAAAPDESF